MERSLRERPARLRLSPSSSPAERFPDRRRSEVLHLPCELERLLADAARRAAPGEACGLLLGRSESSAVRIAELHPVRNLEEQESRFTLDPADHLAGERRAAEQGLSVVGVWHSHPRGDPRPSEGDLAGTPTGWCALIVALGPGGARHLGAWRRDSTGFAPLTLHRAGKAPTRPAQGSR